MTGEITVANAGHPPPLLVTGAGAEFVQTPVGRPLGAGRFTAESATFTMPAGSTLFCYTDGLIERRSEDIDAGLRRLAHEVASVVQQPLDVLISTVIASMRDDSPADDIAVLALRRLETKTRLTADQHAPGTARDFVRQQLTDSELPAGVKVEDVAAGHQRAGHQRRPGRCEPLELEVDLTETGSTSPCRTTPRVGRS